MTEQSPDHDGSSGDASDGDDGPREGDDAPREADGGPGETADAPRCERCGERADDATRRVVTAVEDGSAVHRHFCGDDCLEAWRS